MPLLIQFGAFPDLSRAELCARVPACANGHLIAGRFFLTDAPLSPAWAIENLGGVVKIAEILEEEAVPEALAAVVLKYTPESKKIIFGISSATTTKIGFEIKRVLRELTEQPVRLVTSRTTEFSSATTILEHLLPPDGVELQIIKGGHRTVVARTVAAQQFSDWSLRDFGRPGRNARRGMLPPKLARMMVNLALGERDTSAAVVYDPFCGSGAVVSEALLLGARTVFGSDISPAAVQDTKKMVSWLKREANLFTHDATKPATQIKNGSVDAVVAEPFLGRPLSRGEELTTDEKHDLVNLYAVALRQLAPKLSLNGRIVLALPFFRQKNGDEDLPLDKILEKTGLKIDPLLPDHPTIRYFRPDQRTGRVLVRLITSD